MSTSGLQRHGATWRQGEPVEIWFPDENLVQSLRGKLIAAARTGWGSNFPAVPAGAEIAHQGALFAGRPLAGVG